MRQPQKPPDVLDFSREHDRADFGAAVRAMGRPEVEKFVRSVNEKYLHWDRLRYQALPPDVDAKLIWTAALMFRLGQRQQLPLSFTGGAKLSYVIAPTHLEWLHNIDKRAGGAIGVGSEIGLVDDDDRYLFNSLMEEAIASSQLEGASTTRKIAKEMLRANRKPRNRAEQMILNNYRAILEVRDLKKQSLTPELLCHLQEVLTKETLEQDAAGRFRRSDEQIVVQDTQTGEPLHVPPAADEIESRIKELCDFANAISKPFIHPVIKAAVLHFAIGFIHPFVDGNGRTARAIFYWYMLKRNYWLFEYIPISRVLVKSPVKYARAYLYTETDAGDVTYFVRYHLQTILAAIDDFDRYVLNEHRETRQAAQLLESLPGLNNRQRSLVHDALKHPNMNWTLRSHQGKYHVTYPTAHGDLLGLVKAGLLTKVKDGKALRFFPVSNLKKQLHLPSTAGKPEKLKFPKSVAVTKLKNEKVQEEDRDSQMGLFD